MYKTAGTHKETIAKKTHPAAEDSGRKDVSFII